MPGQGETIFVPANSEFQMFCVFSTIILLPDLTDSGKMNMLSGNSGARCPRIPVTLKGAEKWN